MWRYLARRLLLYIPVILMVSLMVFAIMRVMPGDLARVMLVGSEGVGQATPEALARLREELGLNKPLHVQYIEWLWGLVRLDVGLSPFTKQPVMEEIVKRLPVSAELAVIAVLISVTVAVPLGVVSALFQDRGLDYFVRIISIAGLTVPTFFTGTLLILALVGVFNWIPPLLYAPFWQDPRDNLIHMIWPALIQGYYHAAVISRMTRSQTLEVLRLDYVRTAWAKGLPQRLVVARHVVRNALLPVVTLVGVEFGILLSGVVVMETIFNLPGLGSYLVESIRSRDYVALQTVMVLVALLYLTVNVVVDLLYAWLDPRIRYS
ncbi:MAG: ABC transporter permease [Chloroflexi bacterium]|nr:ABC transporter permease [Chloroflexota bacterium]